MHQQSLHCVAHRRTLHLGVEANALGGFQRRLGIDVDVANALVVLDHRNFRIRHHRANQVFAAARDDQVDVRFELQQLVHERVLFDFDHLHGVARHRGVGAGIAHSTAPIA